MQPHPMLDQLTSGYIRRVADRFPMAGDREPWVNPQDYRTDRSMFRKAPVDDGVMQFTAPTSRLGSAAMAAQQQRSETASFMQSQMRTQLENQQKAQTVALQDQINLRSQTNRDIQNAIALAIAEANVSYETANGNILDVQDGLIAQNDALILQDSYWANINAELAERNRLLKETASITPGPAPVVKEDAAKIVPKDIDIAGQIKKATKKKKGKGKAFGGWVPGIGNSDNVPLLATPGEFVMRKAAAARFGPTLQAMNSGSFKGVESSGGGTTIGSVVFNINGANLNEREVAEIAVRKMKSLESATIRSGRF
jgi:hypothetical protein